MNRRTLVRTAVPVAVVGVVVAAYFSPLGEWLTLERLAESRDALAVLVEARPWAWATLFLLLCIAASALCFPAAPLIGVAGGAMFGIWGGLAILAIGFTIGSTLACYGTRRLFRAAVQARLGRRMEAIDRGLAAHGPFYLLALRLNPFIPYWLVNLAMGVTAMRQRTYIALTATGLLPALFIYASAGSRLSTLGNGGEIVSPGLLIMLLLLSLLMLAADRLRPRRATVGQLP